jgi:ComF family protein
LINYWSKLNQLLFSQACMLCAAGNGQTLGLCKACLDSLLWHKTAHCPQCALPSMSSLLCGHCLKSPPAFDATYAMFRYEYPLDSMLQRYKYNHLLNMAETFGELMAQSMVPASHPDNLRVAPDIIIPMPLHPRRLQERGFNQAVEIARIIGKKLKLEVDSQSCRKIKLSAPQVSLPLKERVKNMRGAFDCQTRLDGLHIALVDDVMTTGASLSALASTVKKAGASHVECWLVARTLPY